MQRKTYRNPTSNIQHPTSIQNLSPFTIHHSLPTAGRARARFDSRLDRADRRRVGILRDLRGDVSGEQFLPFPQRSDHIGGVVGSKKNFYMNLFGPDFLSRDGHNSVLDMYVTARALRPGQSGRRSYFPRTPRETSKIKQDPPRREDPRDLFRH